MSIKIDRLLNRECKQPELGPQDGPKNEVVPGLSREHVTEFLNIVRSTRNEWSRQQGRLKFSKTLTGCKRVNGRWVIKKPEADAP